MASCIKNRFFRKSLNNFNINDFYISFLNYLKSSNNEAKEFLSKNGQIILRMRGLPFESTAKDVVDFFRRGENSCEIVDRESGVLFVHYPDGRATGDAFVMFKTEEEANQAILKHKETMGTRYIELFRSTVAEVQQVFKRSQDPKNFHINSKDIQLPSLPILSPELIAGNSKKDCIHLRNLPTDCGVDSILEFLGIHSQHIVQQGVHLILNSIGHPSGEVFIQLDGEQSSQNAVLHKNGKIMYFMGQKYIIEVTQCSGEEMNLVLMGLLSSNSINQLSNNQLLQSNLTSNVYSTFNQIPGYFYSNFDQTINATQIPMLPNQYVNQPEAYSPVMWYYPTQSISPTSYFLQSQMLQSFNSPVNLILKNVPYDISSEEIYEFLNGYEIMFDSIQILKNFETNSSDVLIALYNRIEAERILVEKNCHKIRDRKIDIYLSV